MAFFTYRLWSVNCDLPEIWSVWACLQVTCEVFILLSMCEQLNTPIYRYHTPLRILFWLNNRDPFRGGKQKGQPNDFRLNLGIRSINIKQKQFYKPFIKLFKHI